MQGPAVQVDVAKTFTPYDRQANWLASDALFRLFLGGVGSGKSWSLTLWCVLQQLANPGVEGALLGRTTNDLINPLLPEYFGHLQKLQDATGVSYITDYNKGQGYVDLLGGGRCWFRPYNRIAKIRGISIGWAACDEIEWSEADPEEVWTVLTGRMRVHCPRPGLAFATSPNGLRGITKRFVDCQREYTEAVKKGDRRAEQRLGRYYTTVSTSYDNPYLPDYYFDALRSMSRRRYKQEVEGKVLRPLNTVWQLEARHVVPWQWQQHRHLDRVYGIDWGGQDHHVAVMAQVTSSGAWIVADELICDDMPRGHFQDKLTHWMTQHGPADPALIAVDRAAPVENQLLQQRWRKTQVRWMESKDQQKVEHGIEIVRDMMDPCDGEPSLMFSSSLAQSVSGVTAPIVPALRGYCYHISSEGVQLKPKKDNTNDHACHPAGTMVRMADGTSRPIEEVRAGDLVATRSGARVVTCAASTGVKPLLRLLTARGHTLEATADHPVWTTRGGMTRLDALRYGDTLWSCENTPSPSTASATADTLTAATPATEITSSGQDPTCTGMSGSTTMARSQQAGTSTTSTATAQTTPSATLPACHPQTTASSTLSQKPSATSGAQPSWNGSKPCMPGAERQKGAHGPATKPAQNGQRANTSSTHANTAGPPTPQRIGSPSASVATHAGQQAGARLVWTTRLGFALRAAQDSPSTDTAKPDAAVDAVAAIIATGVSAQVYSLTVEGAHEYFANGILVSNCDALRYIVAAGAHDPKLHGGRSLWRGATGPKQRAGDSYDRRPGRSDRQVL